MSVLDPVLVGSSVSPELQQEFFWNLVTDTERHHFKPRIDSTASQNQTKKASCIDTTAHIATDLTGRGIANGLIFDGGHFWNVAQTAGAQWYLDGYYGLLQQAGGHLLHIDVAPREVVCYELNFTEQAVKGLALACPTAMAFRTRNDATSEPLSLEEAVTFARGDDLLRSLDELLVTGPAVTSFLHSLLTTKRTS